MPPTIERETDLPKACWLCIMLARDGTVYIRLPRIYTAEPQKYASVTTASEVLSFVRDRAIGLNCYEYVPYVFPGARS